MQKPTDLWTACLHSHIPVIKRKKKRELFIDSDIWLKKEREGGKRERQRGGGRERERERERERREREREREKERKRDWERERERERKGEREGGEEGTTLRQYTALTVVFRCWSDSWECRHACISSCTSLRVVFASALNPYKEKVEKQDKTEKKKHGYWNWNNYQK